MNQRKAFISFLTKHNYNIGILDEFRRAVKVSTGHDLSPHMIKTLFELFDKDGDGKLSYVEFIGVMKDRIHRGFRVR